MKKSLIGILTLSALTAYAADETYTCQFEGSPELVVRISDTTKLASLKFIKKDGKVSPCVSAKLKLIIKTKDETRLYEGDDNSADHKCLASQNGNSYATGELTPYTLVITSIGSPRIISYNRLWTCER